MNEIGCRVGWMFIVAVMALACGGRAGPGTEIDPEVGDAGPDATLPGDAAPADAAPAPRDPDELVEDRSVYEQDDLQVRTIHLSVSDLDGLDDVHDNVPGAEVEVLFQEGDFGAGETAPNGKLRLRGASARYAPQKSYRVKLYSKTELWRGYRVIHLNKHHYDRVRVRQKLSFDYFREIRHFTSLRNGFVRLYINGEDMGFYTQTERPDERFLVAHGLDPAGQIYKAKELTFQDIPEEAWRDPDALEEYVEVEANPNHEKFRDMLAAVRDKSRDIDEVVDTYFHRENYLTWLAVNALMGNFDTITQNYILYSPSDSQRWYFLPWDYDDCWGASQQIGEPPRARNKSGIGNWWFPKLHNRFLRKPGNAGDLARMVRHLADEVITPARTAALLARYHDIVRPHVLVAPDIDHLPPSSADTPEEKRTIFDEEYARVAERSEQFRQELLASLEWPMPVWVSRPPQVDGNRVRFRWSASFDLQGDRITYDLLVSTSPGFEEGTIVAQRTGLEDREVAIELPGGVYFGRVIARDDDDPEEHWQQCGNAYHESDYGRYYWCAVRVDVD